MFSSVFLVSVWFNLPDDLRDDSRCWGILNFYSKCLHHYFNSTIANWECFLLACVFLAAGDGRHQSFPPRQRTLDEVWRSGDGNDHHQGWKVERRDNYSVFFLFSFGRSNCVNCTRMHNMLQAPRGRLASEGRSAVFSLLSNFWDFIIFFFFFFFFFLQEDVPQLQGEGHRTQPQNQVHTSDGHRASGRPSIQIRGQQMVRTSQHLHTQMNPQTSRVMQDPPR